MMGEADWGRHRGHADWRKGPSRAAGAAAPRATTTRNREVQEKLLKLARDYVGRIHVDDMSRQVMLLARPLPGRAAPEDEALRPIVERLVQELSQVKAELAALRAERAVVEIQDRPREEVVAMVTQYYDDHKGQELYPSDVAAALGLDAYVVFQVTNELVAQGRLL